MEYNLKIKEYKEQYVISTYTNSIKDREEMENLIIQLKRIRSKYSKLLRECDDMQGKGIYYVDDLNNWYDEKNEFYFDNDIDIKENVKNVLEFFVPTHWIATIKSDFEKEERSLSTSIARTKNKIYDIAYSNDWNMFITLTFDDDLLIKKYGQGAWDYDTCVKCLHSFFTILRRKYKNVQYLGVMELHHNFYDIVNGNEVIYNNQILDDKTYNVILDKQNRTNLENDIIKNVNNGTYKRRYHFHFLFNNYPLCELVDSGKRDAKGRIIYNLLNYTLGFTTCTLLDDVKASQFYITKYVTKDLIATTKCKKRYWASRNLNKVVENNYFLEDVDLKNIQEELCDDSDYTKSIKVENDNFTNIIYKYILHDFKIKDNSMILDYVDKKTNVITLDNSIITFRKIQKYTKNKTFDYCKFLEDYFSVNSIFNSFNNKDYQIYLLDNKYFELRRINNKIVCKEI